MYIHTKKSTNQNTVFNTRHKKFSYSKIDQSKHCIQYETQKILILKNQPIKTLYSPRDTQISESICWRNKKKSINQSTVFKRHVDFRISMLSKLKKLTNHSTVFNMRHKISESVCWGNLKINQSKHCIQHETQISE